MRAVLAGLFVFGGAFAAVAFLGATGLMESLPRWLVGILMPLLLLLLVAVAWWLFNKPGVHPLGLKSIAEQVAELESQGLLFDTDYRAVRAFAVEEYEDAGLHYFVELQDGRVLFLSGQYLYEYVPSDDDPELNQRRRFPCTEFTVRRHKTKRYAVDIVCGGAVLEPEFVAAPFQPADWEAGLPEDGDGGAPGHGTVGGKDHGNSVSRFGPHDTPTDSRTGAERNRDPRSRMRQPARPDLWEPRVGQPPGATRQAGHHLAWARLCI